MMLITIDYNIPLWGIITFIVSITWVLISMYFRVERLKSKQKETEDEIAGIFVMLDMNKKDLEAKMDSHKVYADSRLLEINNIVVSTKTLVELLVQNKIKD